MITSNSVEKNIELLKEYYSWKRSIKLLDRIEKEVLDGKIDRAQVKAGLENAIMYLLLHADYDGKDLFELLTKPTLLYGFECIDIKGVTDEHGEKMMAIVNEESEIKKFDTETQKAPEITITAEQFTIGDFKVDRNQYVDKAYNFVAKKEGEEAAAAHLLRCALRYASIYSETRHIGPPQTVYDAFYKWGVRNEGFASPFNARVLGKEDAQFYSLFKDTDAVFGSGGSFFHLSEPHNPGHWSLDPPFLTETMDRVDKRIGEWRQKYPEIAILLIIPASHTPANKPDETVILKAGTHHYEGLAGTMNPLPVDVCIHRYGNLEGFSAETIIEGYTP